jgi:ribonuclease R|tara:strand:+ start:18841 stop:20769 length:1929 start_codon:yes stop_codon:yes gene_type:complete
LKKKKKKHNNQEKTFTGIVDHVKKRFCFISVDEITEDIKIKSRNMKSAIHGDKVLVTLLNNFSYKNFEGEIIKILERSKSEYIGKIQDNGDFAFFIPDNKKIYNDFFIKKKKKIRYDENLKVLVKVNNWNSRRKPEAEIIKVIGKSGENETEISSIIHDYNLPTAFPNVVENEAANLKNEIPNDEIKKRKDLRNITTFTIDPEDAKDFDDALSIKINNKNSFSIGIHIADVSHFFTTKSEINKEAEKRATSTYLVDRTIPMLPERLSNNLCSLKPNTDRLTFSVIFDINKEARINNIWIGKTIIHSDKRFTYENAQHAIDKNNTPYSEGLIILNSLSKIIRKNRFESGAFNFRSEEIKFKLDENKKPISVYKKNRQDTHKMIEEYMLLANKIVAEKINEFEKTNKQKYTFVYRIHEDPKEEKLIELKNYIDQFGYQLNTEENNLSNSLNKLMEKIKGKPEEGSIEKFAIKSMSKAKYSTKKEKHFGLAFPNYTHFTSPIRRFPDVMVHRLLFKYLNFSKSLDKTYYEKLCKHSSKMEINATKAERESIKFKQTEYMANFINQKFEAIITGVTEWGIYAEIIKTKCEGLIRISSMKDDYYNFDDKKIRIVGKRSKKIYQLGQNINILVINTDINKRNIDLEIV